MASKNGKILVVDDNAGIRRTLEILLPVHFAEVKTIPSPVTLVSTLEQFQPEVVLLDMNFHTSINTGNEGLYWAGEIKKMVPEIEVVLFTAYADIQLAVEGMKRGAFDFIVKPWENDKLISVLTAARDKAWKASRRNRRSEPAMAENAVIPGSTSSVIPGSSSTVIPGSSSTVIPGLTRNPSIQDTSGDPMFWGSTPSMKAIRKTLDKIAPTDATVLITGENGTGKDVLAREIHSRSLRKDRPMVVVDAGAITETLFESELFGHVKGAFTDAYTDHVGKFEQADEGTLFLDEIGNIPLHLQAKLLRVIQNRSVVRVGGTKAIPVNIRLICATNKDLEALVREGRFREDLYYRINTVHIALPPLRERQEDIVPLAETFLKVFAEKYHRPLTGLAADAAAALLAQRWGGNIRELQNCIEKAVILSEGTVLTASDLALDARSQPGMTDSSAPASTVIPGMNSSVIPGMNSSVIPGLNSSVIPGLNSSVIPGLTRNPSDPAAEERLVRDAMQRTGGNVSAAAKLLGVSRPTLYAKLKKYGL